MTDPDLLSIPPMITLQTPRLTLRTSRVSDTKACMPMFTDANTMKFTSGVVANDLEAAERWMSARVLGRNVFNFLITLKREEGDGQEEVVVGMMGSYHWPEIGYLVHPAHTGKGYATEALRAFIAAFFAHVPSPILSKKSNPNPNDPVPDPVHGFDYIQAETDAANTGSQRVLLKCGFELVETLVGGFESPTLGVRDTLIYRIARPGLELGDVGGGEGVVRLNELYTRRWEEEKEEALEGGFVPPVQ